jgi:predicted nuclease of predicted toxin-antitoxin system
MRLLADENVPGGLVAALRAAGWDVAWVRQDAPGLSDQKILEWAQLDERVVLTFDKDFGDLAYEARLAAQAGVILVRPQTLLDEATVASLVTLLLSREDWAGHLSVVARDRVRMRDLP